MYDFTENLPHHLLDKLCTRKKIIFHVQREELNFLPARRSIHQPSLAMKTIGKLNVQETILHQQDHRYLQASTSLLLLGQGQSLERSPLARELRECHCISSLNSIYTLICKTCKFCPKTSSSRVNNFSTTYNTKALRREAFYKHKKSFFI